MQGQVMLPALQLLQTKKAQRLLGVPGIPLRQPHVQQAARAGVRRLCPRTRGSRVDPGFAKERSGRRALPLSGAAIGDYDLPENGSAIRAMLLRGLEAAQDARS